jgi:hypothetical protein
MTSTWLDPWTVADLAQAGPWGDGAGWGGIDPDEVEYGTSLAELTERYPLLGDFLEPLHWRVTRARSSNVSR